MANSSAGSIAAEISKARARVARLQQNSTQKQDDDGPSINPLSDEHGGNNIRDSVTIELFKRAREAEDQIEFISLNRDVVKLISEIATNNNNRPSGAGDADAAAGGNPNSTSTLANALETCTSLGLLLLKHQNSNASKNGSGKSGQFHSALVQWYKSLHNSTKQMATNIFRHGLRKIAPEYPSTEKSSALVTDALLALKSPSTTTDEWNMAAKCLVELQIVQDALFNVHITTSWRLTLVDELCKPLVERLRFHFLEEQTGIMTATAESDGNTSVQARLGDANHVLHEEHQGQHQNRQRCTSKMDRLPEWLFRYLREAVENHGLYSLMMDGVQPMIDSVLDSLLVCASMIDEGSGSDGGEFGLVGDNDAMMEPESADVETITTYEILQRLKDQYYNHSSTYFLREVARMARHTLRAKSFFNNPDIVGSDCRDRTTVLRGIEQLFLFDAFVKEHIKEVGMVAPFIIPPRMVDTFLSSNEFLMQWWLEEERDGAISSLHRCASTSLSSYHHDDGDDKDGLVNATVGIESSNTNQQQQMYPPISEHFVALLHSARSKASTFFDSPPRQMYIANVIAPLCSEYLDMVHSQAAYLRKKLLARPPTTSSTPGVSVLRSANLPSAELLKSNTMEWASLITGVHLSAQSVLHPTAKLCTPQSSGDVEHESHILDRVGESMGLLCDAMVEDFTSAFVETIIMERAKLASYTMRAPFLLSEPPHGSPGRRGQREKDKSSGSSLSLSPDLNDSIHVMSVVVKACNATALKLQTMFQSNGDGSNYDAEPAPVDTSAMLYFGSQSIHEALKFAISQKLLDIAIDPQGMCPEIYESGAKQFQHDVLAFERLFHLTGSAARLVGNAEHGPMERVVTASRLMSLESSKIQPIREALKALTESSGIGSLFGRSHDLDTIEGGGMVHRLDVDDFYRDERLLEEANSMLEVKGFGALSLDEALSIINRRC